MFLYPLAVQKHHQKAHTGLPLFCRLYARIGIGFGSPYHISFRHDNSFICLLFKIIISKRQSGYKYVAHIFPPKSGFQGKLHRHTSSSPLCIFPYIKIKYKIITQRKDGFVKRILFLVPRMNIGGAETYVYTAAKELRARGYEVFSLPAAEVWQIN